MFPLCVLTVPSDCSEDHALSNGSANTDTDAPYIDLGRRACIIVGLNETHSCRSQKAPLAWLRLIARLHPPATGRLAGHFSSIKSRICAARSIDFLVYISAQNSVPCLACLPCHQLREVAVAVAPSRSQSPARWRASVLRSWSSRSLGSKCGR
jgi:hypothetical protein